MKKLFYILLLSTQFFWAQSGFDNGNARYRKGDYEGAVTAYESVLRSKKESAELYFNLGNAYFKLNKVAPAIYNYEKALLLKPNDAEITNNLKFARKMQIDDIKEIPKVGFHKMIRDFTSAYHYDGWAWISIGFAVAFLLFFIGYYFSQYTLYKRLFFAGMLLAVVFVVAGIFAAVFEKSIYENEKPAIVFTGITGVKSEPDANATDAFVLHEGTKVFILESLDNWKKIELPDGNQGWIEATAIKELK